MTQQVQKRPGQRLRVTVEEMGPLGEAVAHHDGKRVIVFGAIPGEEVVAEVIRERRRYVAARVVEVVRPSPQRVEAPCPYFGPCSGCQWQHIQYQHQLDMKRDIVVDALDRVGGLSGVPVMPTIAAREPYGYRNHARFTVGPQGTLGFVNRETRQFVPIDACLLMHPRINEALGTLQGRCEETTQLSVRYGVNTGGLLIQPVLRNPDIPLESGQKHLCEKVGSRSFRVAASSFFQVNTRQAQQVAELVVERLQLTGKELVVDAYAGVGTFAAFLAPRARKVVAIEESASAVQDAQVNLEGIPNAELWQEKAEEALARLDKAPDAVILDPPRTGCHRRALEALNRLAPQRIVYVSCDPETQARDLRLLCDGPFQLQEVQPVDMFPQTHLVESVATLVLDPAKWSQLERRRHLVLASASPRRREILHQMGLEFQVEPSGDEESTPVGGSAVEQAEQRALAKAQSGATHLGSGTTIGADTVVVDPETGFPLGKPRTPQEARDMLRHLRGREHRVITGVAVVDAETGVSLTGHRSTRVTMRDYSDEEIEASVTSGDPFDKAGGYGVQDPALQPAAEVRGCYLNVVGLPPCTLLRLLERLNVSVRLNPLWRPPGDCRDCRRWASGEGRG